MKYLYIKCDNLLDNYRARINERINERHSSKNIYAKKSFVNPSNKNKVIDISTHSLALQSEGFARWLKLQNLKNMAKSWNDISDSTADLESFYTKANAIYDEFGEMQNQIKMIENKIQNITDKIKNITTYKKYKDINDRYNKSSDKDAFFRFHEKEIILYEAASESLVKPITDKLLDSVPELQKNLLSLSADFDKLAKQFAKQKNKVSEINSLRTNLETYLKSNINFIDRQH